MLSRSRSPFSYLGDHQMTPFLLSALGIHLLVVLFFYILTIFSPWSSKPTTSLIVGPTIKVDVVAMPKLTLKELKNIEESGLLTEGSEVDKAPTKVEEKSEDSVVYKEVGKNEKSQDGFLSALKKLSQKKIDTTVKEVAVKSKGIKKDGQLQAKLDELIFAGNKLSKGTGLTGSHTTEESSEFYAYGERVIDVVRPYWNLPSYLKELNLANQVQVFLTSSGKVVSVSIFKSSGNDQYDERTLEAVKRAAPFPPPPETLRESLFKQGIILAFPI